MADDGRQDARAACQRDAEASGSDREDNFEKLDPGLCQGSEADGQGPGGIRQIQGPDQRGGQMTW